MKEKKRFDLMTDEELDIAYGIRNAREVIRLINKRCDRIAKDYAEVKCKAQKEEK